VSQAPEAVANEAQKWWAQPSVIALLAANVLPLFGVLFFKWEVFPLMLLFWMENVVVGIINVLKMALAPTEDGAGMLNKLFLIPFFCAHYGIFTLVHGMFVIGLFGGGFRAGGPGPDPGALVSAIREQHLQWIVLAMAASHGFSFFHNYLARNERANANVQSLMVSPYGRVIVLHVAILGGAFLIAALRSPIWGLILLIALKTTLDVKAHLRERRKFAGSPGCRQD
jgi:hypothetical protein